MHLRKKKHRGHFRSLVSFLLVLSVTMIAFVHPSPVAATPTAGLMIPLYSYPGGTWTALANIARANLDVPIIAIINPSSGPGSASDPIYVSGIRALETAGVTVIGYVPTGYASRNLSQVEGMISQYRNWYPVAGIFFDEMSNVAGQEGYYSTLSAYARSLGLSFTVGNPGTDTLPSYIGTVTNLVIYEDQGLPTPSSLGGWHSHYGKGNFAMIAYGVPSIDLGSISGAAQYVGYEYVTQASLPNPYGALPSYLAAEVADLGGSPITTASTTTTITTTTTSTTSDSGGGTGPGTTVRSTDQNGNGITGYYTVLYDSAGATISTGFTPTTFATGAGQSYSVRVDDYGGCIFSRWADGGTSNPRSFAATSAMSFTAVYSCATTTTTTTTTTTYVPPTPFYPIVVNAALLDGSPLHGASASILYFGSPISQGYTPVTYVGSSGVALSVSTSDFQSYIFDHWSDGNTSNTRIITLNHAVSLIAYFRYVKPHFSFTVASRSTSGADLTGMPVTVMANGSIVAHGPTPFTFDTISGATYTISVDRNGPYSFDHWSNGIHVPAVNMTSGGATTLVAFYKPQYAFPIIVKSASSPGGTPIDGLWVIVKANGSIVSQGPAPLVINGTYGTTYAVTFASVANYTFAGWYGGGLGQEMTFTLAGPTTLEAVFEFAPSTSGDPAT